MSRSNRTEEPATDLQAVRPAPRPPVVAVRPGRACTKTAAARQSLIASIGLVALKVAVGLFSGSVSVLSEAVHSGADTLAATLAFFSVRAAEAPPDEAHPYGHGKAEHLAAAAEALLIFGAASYVVYQSIHRLAGGVVPEHLHLAIAVMAVSALVNLAVSQRLFRAAAATQSPALAADACHLRTDVLSSAGVFLGLLLIGVTGHAWIDPVVGLAVAGLIYRIGWNLSREATGHLMDQGLPEEEIGRLRAILEEEPRLLGYHRVRARRAGSQRHIDLHLLVDPETSLRAAHELAEAVEDRIRAAFPGVVVMTHVEPATDEELAVEAGEPGIWKGVHRTPGRRD